MLLKIFLNINDNKTITNVPKTPVIYSPFSNYVLANPKSAIFILVFCIYVWS